MMRAILTAAGVLIGPVVGFIVAGRLYSTGHHQELDFGPFFKSLLIGAPLGLLTFGVIGFYLGNLLDIRANRRRIDEEIAQRERDAQFWRSISAPADAGTILPSTFSENELEQRPTLDGGTSPGEPNAGRTP